MNFFEQQTKARKFTTRLLILYFLSVVAIIIVIAGPLSIAKVGPDTPGKRIFINSGKFSPTSTLTFDFSRFTGVGTLIVALIAAGTLFKFWQLSRGGKVVAEMLGGRLVATNSSDEGERRLLNVVEEISIASGVPIPAIYVLEEDGINAFAAGLSPADPVIAVTKGAIAALSRDELQGVIAHEFSHIFNGDMRMNLRLVAILSGIVLVSSAGYVIIRIAGSSSDDDGKATMALFLVGLLLFIVGYVGSVGASIIQAAVSRQREYLADASAVQFTRNKDGIAGALKKIAGTSSTLSNRHASEFSHFYFSEGLSLGFNHLFATHPPLRKRIAAIEGVPEESIELGVNEDSLKSQSDGPANSIAMGFAGNSNISAARIVQAKGILSNLDSNLRNLANEPSGARAVIVYLLFNSQSDSFSTQTELLNKFSDDLLTKDIDKIVSLNFDLKSSDRLALAAVAISSLRNISQANYIKFRQLVSDLIAADHEYSLFEFALNRMMRRQLDRFFLTGFVVNKTVPNQDEFNFGSTKVLSALVCFCNDAEVARQTAYTSGMEKLGLNNSVLDTNVSLTQVGQHLDALVNASVELRRKLLDACLSAITIDGVVSSSEEEMVRAIAASLDTPLPRNIADQQLRA